MKKDLLKMGVSKQKTFHHKLYCSLLFAFFFHITTYAQLNLQITEIFSGQSGTDLTSDWFEIKNTGDVSWTSGVDADLYYDDESAAPADASLIQGITDIKAGESVIVLITGDIADITTFQLVWEAVANLNGIEVGYTDGAGLGGGGDVVNLWIGDPAASAPVDTEAYPDTGANDGQSYDVTLAAFSEVGNANGAVQTLALGGDGSVPNIASPGDLGPVVTDANAPLISGDTDAAAPFLDIPAQGSAVVGADIGDPTDPAATLGIPFVLTDADTPPGELVLTATSDNQLVVPDAGLAISGTEGNRLLKITPAAIGYANITLTVSDPDGKTGTYTIAYAASSATLNPGTSIFHHGASDGSTAITTGTDHMWVADDEGQTVRLYDRTQSGLPLTGINFNAALGSDDEIDTEASFRNGSTIFFIGSHTNADRSLIYSVSESGEGATSTLTFSGFYDDLSVDLANWDTGDGHSLGAGHYGLANGFEIEGLSADPNNAAGALLAFRGPVVDGKALIVPVTNFQTIVAANPTPNSATFGTPIELDLGGNSIRSIECNDNGCLIVAGPAGAVNTFRLFTWSGNAGDAPELRTADLDELTNMSSFEGIVGLPAGPFLGNDGDAVSVQLLVDTGTFDYYNDGNEAKDLANEAWKKFRTEIITLGAVTELPVANPGDVVITEILQNPSMVPDNDGEWFEVYNSTSATIDLNGWLIADEDSDTHVIDNGGPLEIPAGGYLVLGNNADMTTNGGVAVDYQYTSFTLSNSDDELILIAPDSVEIDRVAWDGGTLFPDPTGASMALQAFNLDNNVGTNWCESVTPYGLGDFGTPGSANDCTPPPVADLRITEIWPGQDGTDLTADWFEITNFGEVAWVAGIDGELYYDDESQEPADADLINGILDIQPGESVIVMVDQAAAVDVFRSVWEPVYNLTDVEIGWTDGAGLGQGGDGVTLFMGVPSSESIVDVASYPAAPSGLSYDLILEAFSQQGGGHFELGTNTAVATIATGGNDGLEPAIGSPGNQGPLVVPTVDLQITEIFAGQAGDDLTADWFEIKNLGTTAWVSGIDPALYYDDESAEPADADLIQGITTILPGATAVVLITDNVEDITAFTDVWSPVIDLSSVAIGYTDGAGLGGGGDAVTLWLGDPTTSSPVDTASYPDTELNDGQSYDVTLQAFSEAGNASGAVQTVALGGDLMDVPNIGSPGDGLAIPSVSGLQITEIFAGQEGDDLTADWFEIKNTGTEAWVSGVDPDLYYDDESASAADADLIQGITTILPGATAVVLITDNMEDITAFTDVWSPVIDLSSVAIGYTDGAGLGGGGDAVTLWLGDPTTSSPVDTASYPDTELNDGQSYDVTLQAFSEAGNASGAVQTVALGGDLMDVPNIGSPGDGLAIPSVSGLQITEIFAGQEGDDLTADWFEIKNTGTEAWVSGVDPDLYYDDESASAADADLIQGITDIQPGETVIVLLTDAVEDITAFSDVWGAVVDLTDIEIGFADGAGLGGGGDAVTLWMGDPHIFLPLDTASYPDTAPFDGQSFDSELGAFSTVGNANGAVATLALGGDNMDVPNIGSPGNQGPVSTVNENIQVGILKVYPNPSPGLFRVETEALGGNFIERVQVFDLNGQLVYSRYDAGDHTFDLDLTPLPAATYYLKIYSGDHVAVERIVKQ